jgi:hypothetical protein
MKFEVEMTRHEARTVQVFAEDRDAAVKLARASAPGFRAESATVVTEDGEDDGPCHSVNTGCEACGRIIWEGDDYQAGEDADLCATCAPTAADATE